MTQHPDERDGQTKFAIPININLGRTEDELQNVDNEINALTTAFGQVSLLFHVEVHSKCSSTH